MDGRQRSCCVVGSPFSSPLRPSVGCLLAYLCNTYAVRTCIVYGTGVEGGEEREIEWERASVGDEMMSPRRNSTDDGQMANASREGETQERAGRR